MLEVVTLSSVSGGSVDIMSNAADSRNYEKRRDHDHHHQVKNHSQHHRRRYSTGQEGNSDKKRSSERGVSSNSRPHPRAEHKDKLASNNFDHTPTRSVDRKRRARDEEDEADLWTEHKSSSGKIYYYNKKLDKSQWEKPEKGTLKKLKSEKSSKVVSKSVTSKSHSVKKQSTEHDYRHGDRPTPSNIRYGQSADSHKKSSLSTTHHMHSSAVSSHGASSSSPSTPISNHSSSVLSPTSNSVVPLTPTIPRVPPVINKRSSHHHATAPESPLMSSVHTPTLFGSVTHHTGPVTPMTPPPAMLNYGKGLLARPPLPLSSPAFNQGMEAQLYGTPQHTAAVSTTALRHSVYQYTTQVYATSPGATPVHVMTPSMSSAVPSNSFSTTPLSTVDLYQESSNVISQSFLTPMSKLGRWVNGIPPSEVNFPDPDSLQTLPHLASINSEILSKVLAERMWSGQFDGIQKQVDHTQLEVLSRLTVDHSYHCGQLAKSLLSLECSRIKEASRSVRIMDLKSIKDEVEKR